MINLSQNGKKLTVFYASSGVQSAMPIEVMIDRYSAIVGERASISKHDWRHIFDEMKNSNVEQSAIANKAGKAYYQSVQFFIEEPEQNLFPEPQKDLLLNIIKHLVFVNSNEKAKQRSMVVLTTHSPYILSVINELMAEAKLYDLHYEKPIEGVVDFINDECIMSSDYYSAYYINDNGTFENLIDSEISLSLFLRTNQTQLWRKPR